MEVDGAKIAFCNKLKTINFFNTRIGLVSKWFRFRIIEQIRKSTKTNCSRILEFGTSALKKKWYASI